MALLELQGVSCQVDHTSILDGLDLMVAEHEIHALLGTNGTGKSTLARLIMGCGGYTLASGQIRFAGTAINDLKIHQRARLGITLAWQEPARFEGITVRDYLSLGEPDVDPTFYLDQVGLDSDAYLGRMVDKTLSGGERKRIELAAVLARRPKLAILDEPAAGVLAGEASRGLIKTRMVLEGQASAEVTGITEGNAAGARGHMDCMEVVKDRAVATAIPVVKVHHPLAKITHEAAIGSVDQQQLETLMARGLTPEQAIDMIVKGLLR